jgi:hypothetical protein
MTLDKLGGGIDFVQDATPPASDAVDGDLYVDTSLSPPQVKVFDAGAATFIRPQTAQNLDQKVSNAGATQSDIASGVDSSNAGGKVNARLDQSVSNAGVNWRSKQPRGESQNLNGGQFSINGSGFLLGISIQQASSVAALDVFLDGSLLHSIDPRDSNQSGTDGGSFISYIHRFESSLTVSETRNVGGEITISFVLD